MGRFGYDLSDIPRLRNQAREFRERGPYKSFSALRDSAEVEGETYRRVILPRQAAVCVVAPHGGNLESGTSEFAGMLAGKEHSLYIFESLKKEGDVSLHVPSTAFDDPDCLALLACAKFAVTVHGCLGSEECLFVGGRNASRVKDLLRYIEDGGVTALRDRIHVGSHRTNICNLPSAGGVQLELTEGLRRHFQTGIEGATFGATNEGLKVVELLRAYLAKMPGIRS